MLTDLRPLARPAGTLICVALAWRFTLGLQPVYALGCLVAAYAACPATWRTRLHSAAAALATRIDAERPALANRLRGPVTVSPSGPVEQTTSVMPFSLDPALRNKLWLPGDPR